MPAGQFAVVLRYLRKLADTPADHETDAQLLARFAAGREEAAFATLLQRHGPLVLGVCRRVLRHEQDAEDACQATFLVLARKAGSIRKGEALPGWLYRVACHIALKARHQAAARRALERQVSDMPQPEPRADRAWKELSAVLDEELSRLPEKYRLPLVLCCLQGKTHAEAARELGWPAGSMSSRMARARDLLRERLTARGVHVSAALLPAALAEGATAASLPGPVFLSTVRAAVAFLDGAGACAGISARTAALAEGALQALFAGKATAAVLLAVALGLSVGGAGLLAGQLPAGRDAQPAQQDPPKPPAEKAHRPQVTDRRQARVDLQGDPLPSRALVRMGSVRLRQSSPRVVFAPDGKTLISAGADFRINTWDAATGTHLRGQAIEGTEDLDRSALNLAPDGRSVLLWHAARPSLLVCAVPSGKRLGSPSMGTGRPYRAAVAPGGRAVAVNELDRRFVRLWDVATGAERRLLEHENADGEIAFSPDGTRLAARGGMDNALRVWDVATGTLLHRIGSRTHSPFTWSPDSKTLAVWCDDNAARQWDVATGKELATFRAAPSNYVTCLAFSPDAKVLAAGGQKGFALWDVAARKELHRVPDLWVWSLAFAPDGKRLAVSEGGRIQVWDVATGKPLLGATGHGDEVDALAVSPDGRFVASGSYAEGTLCLWDADTGRLLPSPPGRALTCRFLCFSPDGKLVASGGHDGFLHLWETATGKEWRRFPIEESGPEGIKSFVDALALSPDGKRIVALTRGGREPRPGEGKLQVNVWETATGKVLKRRSFEAGPFLRASLTPNAADVIVSTPDGLAVQEAVTARALVTIPGAYPFPVASSPDGKRLATLRGPASPPPPRKGGTGAARVFGYATVVGVTEMTSGKEVRRIQTGPASLLAYSPDGRVLATSDGDVVRLWEMATGKEVFRQTRHGDLPGAPAQAAVTSLAFLPDGRRLLTGLGDGTVLVWDLAAEVAAAGDLERLWADLAGDDAGGAFRAVQALATAPGPAVAYLKDHLRPVPEIEPTRVRRLVADLDHAEFAVREAAAKELMSLGAAISPALRQSLKEAPSLEVRRRVEAVLNGFEGKPPPETLRTLRATWVLERAATPEARRLLQELAGGAPEALLTREAKASLERLARRPARKQ